MAATPRQIILIDKLIDERDVPQRVIDKTWLIARNPAASPKRGGPVSRVIDALLAAPKKAPTGAVAGAPARPAARRSADTMLRGAAIPCAKYVLLTDELPAADRHIAGGNERLFVEVKEFRGTRYIRRLHGAPGAFSRSKFGDTGLQARVIETLERVGALVATRRFSAIYTCCSCCGAELTEDDSIRLGMGPVCRRRFGL